MVKDQKDKRWKGKNKAGDPILIEEGENKYDPEDESDYIPTTADYELMKKKKAIEEKNKNPEEGRLDRR